MKPLKQVTPKTLFLCSLLIVSIPTTQSYAVEQEVAVSPLFVLNELDGALDEQTQNLSAFDQNEDRQEQNEFRADSVHQKTHKEKRRERRIKRLTSGMNLGFSFIQGQVSRAVNKMSDSEVSTQAEKIREKMANTDTSSLSDRLLLETSIKNTFREKIPVVAEKIVEKGGLLNFALHLKKEMREIKGEFQAKLSPKQNLNRQPANAISDNLVETIFGTMLLLAILNGCGHSFGVVFATSTVFTELFVAAGAIALLSAVLE